MGLEHARGDDEIVLLIGEEAGNPHWMGHCITLIESHDGLETFLVQIDQLDLIFVRQVGIAEVLEPQHGRVHGRLGDDGVFELSNGLEEFEDAAQGIGV